MIALVGCGSGVVPASSLGSEALQILPNAVNFGSVDVGQTAQSSVAILNQSSSAVAISQLSLSGQVFSIANAAKLPINIPAGATYSLSVGFAPTAAANYSGQITMIDANSKPIAQLAMSGSGSMDGQLSVSTTSLSFGNVVVNSPSIQTVTLTSTGTTPIAVNSASISGQGFSLLGTSFPVTLNPTQTLTLQVQFDPAASGVANGQLTISSGSTSGNTVVSLSGAGIAAGSSLNSQLTVSAGSLSFGSVTVNTTTVQSLTLTSIGTSPVTVSSAGIAGAGFAIVAQSVPITLNPSQSVTLQIQFDPTIAGSVSGQLVITSNSSTGNPMIVTLSGTGTAANPQLSVSPGSLSFGSVPVNTAASQSLTLTSTGTSLVTVNSVSITGAGFSIIGASFPLTLNPSQSVTLQVQFSPAVSGIATGQIVISNTASSGSSTLVALNGTGAAVAHVVDLSWEAPTTSPDPVAGYNIYRSTGSGLPILINPSPNTAVVYVDNTVVSGTSYSYIVKSVDSTGVESVASNGVTVTIP